MDAPDPVKVAAEPEQTDAAEEVALTVGIALIVKLRVFVFTHPVDPVPVNV